MPMTLRIVRRTLLDFIKYAIRKDDPRSRSNRAFTSDVPNDPMSHRGNQRVRWRTLTRQRPARFPLAQEIDPIRSQAKKGRSISTAGDKVLPGIAAGGGGVE